MTPTEREREERVNYDGLPPMNWGDCVGNAFFVALGIVLLAGLAYRAVTA